MKTTYADSGVNIDLGDDVSKMLYVASKETWKNRKGKIGEVTELFSDFSGLRAVPVGGLPEGTFMNLSFDGIGTKTEIAERVGRHDTAAYDLFAMVCDDAVVRGAEPVLIGSVLDVRSLGSDGKNHIDFVKQLCHGYIGAAEAAGVAVVNGEVAELGARVQGYGDFNYNWGAGLVWFAKKERMFTGNEIKKGDYIVSLREPGLRSNGLSLFRKVMSTVYGNDWHNAMLDDKKIGDLALTPSQIYSKAVVDMFGGYNGEQKVELHGVAHITGGGIPGKLGRVLKPSGLGAVITEPFSPCKLMLHCQEKGNVPDEEAYKTWNMGHGMMIITPQPDKVVEIAKSHGIEARISGTVTSEEGIMIKNRGHFKRDSQDKYLKF